MKILIVVVSHQLQNFNAQIKYIYNFFNENAEKNAYVVEYAAISSNNDFEYIDIFNCFKYKIINKGGQLEKICDFINTHNLLEYDWIVKIRPEIEMFQPIIYSDLCTHSINARARCYKGPKKIKYGASVSNDMIYIADVRTLCDISQEFVILDDQIYIFSNIVIKNGGFVRKSNFHEYAARQHEIDHTEFWKNNGINLNVIGLHVNFNKNKNDWISGDINMGND